jgi:hypothetical protein
VNLVCCPQRQVAQCLAGSSCSQATVCSLCLVHKCALSGCLQLKPRGTSGAALADHLRGMHELANGIVPPTCTMEKDSIVAGVNVVRAKIADAYKVASTAVFFTTTKAAHCQLRIYRSAMCRQYCPNRQRNSNTASVYAMGTDESESGQEGCRPTRVLEDLFPEAEYRWVTSFHDSSATTVHGHAHLSWCQHCRVLSDELGRPSLIPVCAAS